MESFSAGVRGAGAEVWGSPKPSYLDLATKIRDLKPRRKTCNVKSGAGVWGSPQPLDLNPKTGTWTYRNPDLKPEN